MKSKSAQQTRVHLLLNVSLNHAIVFCSDVLKINSNLFTVFSSEHMHSIALLNTVTNSNQSLHSE